VPEPPVATVVVATCNRAALLPRLLEALTSQQLHAPFELVLVDDASGDDTPKVLDELVARSPVPMRTIRLAANSGAAAARNAGWRDAKTPLIVFTDDDCVPQPGWLAAHVDALGRAELTQGRTMPNPTQKPVGTFAWAPDTPAEGAFYETCNMGYTRATLEAVDGFDESFRRPRRARERGKYVSPVWGEDTDLALRAKASGARSTFVADAVVWHDLKRGHLRDRLAEAPRWRGTVILLKRYPRLRREFAWRWVAHPAHALLVAGVIAAVAALFRPTELWRWAVVVVLGLGWASTRGRGYRLKARLRRLPEWLLSDAAEVAVLAAASVRYRTFFL
jgi:glycosyltransferase involved in cell wall biosynthesis